MKTCTNCQEEKPISDFYKQTDRSSGTSRCKACLNTYAAERWTQRKIDAVAYKGGACIECGYDKHHTALQFHHRDPSTKTMDWHKMRLTSLEKMKDELDKCDLLCANCHAEHHWMK